MGILVTLLIIVAVVLVSSLLGLKINVERYTPTSAATTSTASTASNVKKGLPRGNWGWNPAADANYAKKQEQQCTAGGGQITKYSGAFYMCNGAKW